MGRWFDRILEDFTIVLFSILCTVVFVAVVARYMFRSPLMWSEEIIIYLFTWVVFMGSTILYKNQKHISIGVFTSILPSSVKRALSIVGDLLILGFLVILFYQGIILFTLNVDIPSITVPVPVGISTISLPIMALLMIYYNIRQLIHKLRTGGEVAALETDTFNL